MTTNNFPQNYDELDCAGLKGSARQCDWAITIRRQKLTELLEVIGDTRRAQAAWNDGCDELGLPGAVGFMDAAIATEITVLNFLTKVESAVFWIDKRHLPAKKLFAPSGSVSDFISLGEKLLKDAQKPLEKLNGYDLDDLEKYFGKDYRSWFEANNLRLESKP